MGDKLPVKARLVHLTISRERRPTDGRFTLLDVSISPKPLAVTNGFLNFLKLLFLHYFQDYSYL